jgi:glycosyltransferase involved in cell wall biosynthesis
VGRLVEAILASPLSARWELDVFDLSKPQQEGKPSTVTAWDVAWTLAHLVLLPIRVLARRPRVALVQSTADTGFFRDLALVLVLRALAVPVVLHWHGSPESKHFPGLRTGGWRAALFRFGARRARAVILLADPYRAFFERHVEPARLVVVPNFVDGARIAGEGTGPPGARRGEGPVRLVFLGRVGPQKGTDVLLDAFERARARLPGLSLELVGDGETPATFAAAQAHPAVRAGAATLTGPLGDERFARLRSADVFVLPSRDDSFPLSILEAMATGLPVVASGIGAIPWLLEEGACGALVPAGDTAALGTALERLVRNPADRHARGARARARQRAGFDSAGAAAALDQVLRAAAGMTACETA